MKKFFALLCSTALAVTMLSGCGSSSSSTSTDESAQTSQEESSASDESSVDAESSEEDLTAESDANEADSSEEVSSETAESSESEGSGGSTYVSTDTAGFWTDDSTFDMIGYLKACGADPISYYCLETDANGAVLGDTYIYLDEDIGSNIPYGINANFENGVSVIVPLNQVVIFNPKTVDDEGPHRYSWMFMYQYGPEGDDLTLVKIKGTDLQVTKGCIYALPKFLDTISPLPQNASIEDFESVGITGLQTEY